MDIFNHEDYLKQMQRNGLKCTKFECIHYSNCKNAFFGSQKFEPQNVRLETNYNTKTPIGQFMCDSFKEVKVTTYL